MVIPTSRARIGPSRFARHQKIRQSLFERKHQSQIRDRSPISKSAAFLLRALCFDLVVQSAGTGTDLGDRVADRAEAFTDAAVAELADRRLKVVE